MKQSYWVVPCFVLLAAGYAPAQPKTAPPSQKVAVQFVNGSHVVMSLLQEAIEVDTHFGPLKISVNNIRYIEFGLHTPADVDQEVRQSLAKLSSSNYRDREVAASKLVELGPYSYLPLQESAKDGDLENGQRVKEVLAKIEQKFAAAQLRDKRDDQLVTTKFPVVGRVLTTALKVKAEYFGDLELKPSQLLSIRWLEGAGQKEVEIDAAKYGSAPDQWLDTGFSVESYLDLNVRASGKVDLCPQSPGDFVCGPNGLSGGDQNAVLIGNLRGVAAAQQLAGALMGRIGEKGTPFVIGERYQERAASAGRLYLHIMPGPYGNGNGNGSSGSYKVQMTSGFNLFP